MERGQPPLLLNTEVSETRRVGCTIIITYSCFVCIVWTSRSTPLRSNQKYNEDSAIISEAKKLHFWTSLSSQENALWRAFCISTSEHFNEDTLEKRHANPHFGYELWLLGNEDLANKCSARASSLWTIARSRPYHKRLVLRHPRNNFSIFFSPDKALDCCI